MPVIQKRWATRRSEPIPSVHTFVKRRTLAPTSRLSTMMAACGELAPVGNRCCWGRTAASTKFRIRSQRRAALHYFSFRIRRITTSAFELGGLSYLA